MPGGYGRSGPWGSSGDTYGSRPSAPPGRDPGGHHFGGGNQSNQSNQSNQQSQADQRRELAETLQQAGAVTSGALSGNAFWKKAPVGSDPRMQQILDENENVYYSTFGPGSEPWSDSAREYLTGYGGLTQVVPNKYGEIDRMHQFNIWGTPQFPGGYNDPGIGGGYGGGYGGGGGGSGGGGGGGGYAPPEKFMPRGNPNEAWGQQDPMQQMMISLHGGPGFQQGFARGGIVSLVT